MFPFFFDMTYVLVVLLPGLAISGIASMMTKSAFNRYSRQRSATGLTGAEAARMMLDRAGLHNVRIKPTSGYLSDHYNPKTRTLALSEGVYHQPTVAAIGVACHEAGHAIQHARNYAPLSLRSALVPTVGITSNLGLVMMAVGIFLQPLLIFGVVLFSFTVLFQLVTLPVEFDASARAKKLAFQYGLVGPGERQGVAKVLNAAALTYVAAAVSSILTLLYYLWRAGLLGGGDE